MDTRKKQLILQKIALELKHLGWQILPEWEYQIRSEGNIPLTTKIGEVDVNINVSLTDHGDGCYPEYNIYASIYADGIATHDIDERQDVDFSFTDADITNDLKSKTAGKVINTQTTTFINRESGNYNMRNNI